MEAPTGSISDIRTFLQLRVVRNALLAGGQRQPVGHLHTDRDQ